MLYAEKRMLNRVPLVRRDGTLPSAVTIKANADRNPLADG